MEREYAVEYPDGSISTTERGTLDEALADIQLARLLGFGRGKIIVRDDPEGAWVDAGL